MKKLVGMMLLIALVLCALPLGALAEGENEPAWAGDLVVTSTTAYADANMKHPIGRVPAKTAVVCKAYLNGKFYRENNTTLIYYNGKACYVRTSKLLYNNYTALRDVTLPKGTPVFQRPSAKSAYGKLDADKTVWLLGVRGKWALVREATADYNGMFGFVYVGN